MTWWITGLLIASIVSIEARELVRPGVRLIKNHQHGRLLLMRDRRNPIASYNSPRGMMLTGFYQPVRYSTGSQATGVFAQGNAVSGGGYLAGTHSRNYLPRAPEPVAQPHFLSAEAEAEAAPEPEQQGTPVYGNQEDVSYPASQSDQELGNEPETQLKDEDEGLPKVPFQEEEQEDEKVSKPVSVNPQGNKTKKTTVNVATDEEEDEEEEEEDDDTFKPYLPSKSNKGVPNLTNFFPMMFSFPRSAGKSGSSSGSGMITAIANSYSTGKGGVASSVATAYGGSPNGKKKGNQSQE